jgi:fatty-acyl-CoA synthase
MYETHLDRRAANFAPLTPLSFIARTAAIWPQRTAVVHGPRRYTWAESYGRARRRATARAHRSLIHN